jgi:hypothetical protein
MRNRYTDSYVKGSDTDVFRIAVLAPQDAWVFAKLTGCSRKENATCCNASINAFR